MYGLTVSTAPAIEPVTLSEAKAHLRLETSADDSYVTALITVARQYLEQVCNRAFISQTLLLTLDGFPAGRVIRLPRPRAQSVTHIKYVDNGGTLQTLDAASYTLTSGCEPAEIWLKNGYSWPSVQVDNPAAVQVTWVAGYGAAASDVEETVKHAIKFMVAHLYEQREPVNVGNITSELPFTLQSLIDLIRVRVL